MRYRANHSKKVKVKMVTDVLNNAQIFKQEIPEIKVHNRVPDKEYNKKIKTYITQNDIKRHSQNPDLVARDIKIREQANKSYNLRETHHQLNIDFFDNLNLRGHYKTIANEIKDYISKKIEKMNTNTLKYECRLLREEKYYYFYPNPYENYGETKYFIELALEITKYEEDRYTVYYSPSSLIRINLIKANKSLGDLHNYLDIKLDNTFLIFNVIIFV